MKKLNALNFGKSLNRDEMRIISGGLADGGGSFGGDGGDNYVACPNANSCSSDSDCNCRSCGNGTFEYCAQLPCTPSWGGIYNYKKCTCH